jgi:hypothetical protein
LEYAYLVENNIYPVIISANLLSEEEARLLDVLRAHRPSVGYSLDDFKGISHALCIHKINFGRRRQASIFNVAFIQD